MSEILDPLSLFLRDHAYVFVILSWALLTVTLLHGLFLLAEIPAAWWELHQRSQTADAETPQQLLLSDMAPPITIIVPAFNEQTAIRGAVRSLLSLDYPFYELIVVNDGSSDATLQSLIDEFALKPVARAYEPSLNHKPLRGLYASPDYPVLLVADKENGLKADAINAGLNLVRTPLFCVLDADSILEGRALLQAVRPFIEDPVRMVAVGAPVRAVNGCRIEFGRVATAAPAPRYWPLMQTVEYARSFFLGRMARSRFRLLTIISGAFGIFRRDLTVAAGGYSTETLGEDMEIVLKLHRYCLSRRRPYKMRYVADPVCWTEVPETRAALRRQRVRWQRGALECLSLHRSMFFNPRYGTVGMIGMPLTFFLDVIIPLVELLGYITIPLVWIAGLLSLDFLLAYLGLVFVFGICISCSSLMFEETESPFGLGLRNLSLLLVAAVVENFGYRQLNTVWRVTGIWKYLRGHKHVWGHQPRRGHQPVVR